jgi:predicted lysophospholipase L1 biosynthesis ABC-type transport system permease subunit
MTWQALTFGVIALVIGVPVGVAFGRFAWSIATHQLGIPNHPVVTPVEIVAIAVAFLVTLVLMAVVPAQLASRVPAAEVLHRD